MPSSGPVASAVQLLTIPETAARLRCSEMHVYRLIAKGLIRSVDVSQPDSRKAKTRVSEGDLAEYISALGGDHARAGQAEAARPP